MRPESRTCRVCQETKPARDFEGTRRLCRTCRAAQVRRWKLANPERVSVHRKREREKPIVHGPNRKFSQMAAHAHRRGAVGYASPMQIKARIEVWGEKCWICGAPYEEIDHVLPIGLGGPNWPSNIRPAKPNDCVIPFHRSGGQGRRFTT